MPVLQRDRLSVLGSSCKNQKGLFRSGFYRSKALVLKPPQLWINQLQLSGVVLKQTLNFRKNLSDFGIKLRVLWGAPLPNNFDSKLILPGTSDGNLNWASHGPAGGLWLTCCV
jgi:hypothetical protein